MKVGEAVAEIMKREGIEILCGYPVNHLIEFAAAADIRPIMVRQERSGLHMADAITRVPSGRKSGRLGRQPRAGSEDADGGVAAGDSADGAAAGRPLCEPGAGHPAEASRAVRD